MLYFFLRIIHNKESMSVKKEIKQQEVYKKNHNVYSVMGVIGDILFYPIVIITLICCLAIYTAKSENRVPSILGVSMVNIRSGSMEDAGFFKDDIVFLKETAPEKLRAGDIVGYYNTFDRVCDKDVSLTQLTCIQTFSMSKGASEYKTDVMEEFREKERQGTRTPVEKLPSNTTLIFHRIIGVYMKSDGTIFYYLKGDNNALPDSYFIAEDYIIGKYTYTPTVLRGLFSFVSTPTGMISLVVIPLSILILFILFSIIEQVNRMVVERKVLSRKIRFDSEESLQANIGIEMEIDDKVKFYAESPKAEKGDVANFLWRYLAAGTPKEQKEYELIMQAVNKFETKPEEYFKFFIGQAQKKRHKQSIEHNWQDWAIMQKHAETFNKLKKPTKTNKPQQIKVKTEEKPEPKVKETKKVKKESNKKSALPKNVLAKQKKIVKSQKKK